MNDLRKAAEMALDVLRNTVGHSNQSQTRIDDAKHALVQALAQPKQEPVAFVTDSNENNYVSWEESGVVLNAGTPLYTAPPKREWVGLTDAERFYCNEFPMGDCCSDSIIRAEELLKEKNT